MLQMPICMTVGGLGFPGVATHDRIYSNTVFQKKEATIIFDVTLPSVEIFSQLLKHLVRDEFLHGIVYCILTTGVRPLPDVT